MAKISPVSGKYIIHASIQIDGVVDRPDIIGAIFGQTEGLLGSDLELRELQRSGRIGRIEVNTEAKVGKTNGEIIIPSSLDKAETVIVAAALEIIERIGPCNSKILVKSIEDVRISKRNQVIERAKELLRMLTDTVMPDSQEIAEAVTESVRVMEVQAYGKDKLPCGPAIDDSDEIIVVEGRADVLNLLKHGFKNAIAMNGSNVPQTLIDLCKAKTVTVFVDGDRGGILNIKELMSVTEIDFIARAPDGKEVEELAMKEIHKALRSKVAPEQLKGELASKESLRQPIRADVPRNNDRRDSRDSRDSRNDRNGRRDEGRREERREEPRAGAPRASDSELETFVKVLDDLVGSHAAALLDEKLELLGKVPLAEFASTVESLEGVVYAVLVDGSLEEEHTKVAEASRVKFLVGRDTKLRQTDTRVGLVVIN
ncbi:MAG TPA: DNA primase DnaG [Acidobacteriota bacterium]|nr:DNA primase DnaG [Acidobacteriota bacterium]